MLSLELSRSISIAHAINAILLLMAVVGIRLTYRQIRETRLIQKATFFKDLYTTLYGDSEVRDAFYRVEYGEFTYDDNFHGSEREKVMDRLLLRRSMFATYATRRCLQMERWSTADINFYDFTAIRISQNI
jgi:hypothetical protein